MMRIAIPRGHTLERMGGLFAASDQVEPEQPDESQDAERTATPPPRQPTPSRAEDSGGGAIMARGPKSQPVKGIAQACEVLYHWNTP
jgi:hypothetical protein